MKEHGRSEEILWAREAGATLATVILNACNTLAPGETCQQIRENIITFLLLNGMANPQLGKENLGTEGYVSITVNEETFGINPSRRIMHGDLVTIDIVVRIHGAFVDAARTVVVGGGQHPLIIAAREGFLCGASKARAGHKVAEVVDAVLKSCHSFGFSSPKGYCVLHGVGEQMHQPPYGAIGGEDRAKVLSVGQIIAIEAMCIEGSADLRGSRERVLEFTADGSLNALWENTILVGKNECEILTEPE